LTFTKTQGQGETSFVEDQPHLGRLDLEKKVDPSPSLTQQSVIVRSEEGGLKRSSTWQCHY